MITINELVHARRGDLSIVAGHGGGERVISWSHVCDLPDPWTWVRPGDLVLTTGDGLPAEPDAQAEWLSALIDVGISGLVLAPRPGAPSPSPAMMGAANERSVALLTADFSLEFAGLARTVIESAVQSERDHINTARRLFDVYTEALRTRPDLSGRLDAVGRSIGWSISVVRSSDGTVVATGGRAGEAVQPITVPVPGSVAARVEVRPSRRRLLDGSLVHYLAGLVGIELERLTQVDRQRVLKGEAVLRGYLDGSVGAAQLRYELGERNMADTPLTLAQFITVTTPSPPPADWLPGTSGQHVEPLIADDGGGELLALIPADWSDLDAFRLRTAPDAHIGLSAAFVAGVNPVDARVQARIAAQRAVENNRGSVQYAELDDPGGTGPRSATEMRLLVSRVLGPVLEHDRSTGSELLASLELFLQHDGSWAKTAGALGVHRQTLVYRLRQIERLTGLKPTSTEGVARLWIALQAAHTTRAVGPQHKPGK
jgi:PucR family transcriptional regulator, purine catabolism regulatory protein